MDVKTVFAKYNKWDEYSMILLFKDVEMAHDERLVENNGTTTLWLGDQQGPHYSLAMQYCSRSSNLLDKQHSPSAQAIQSLCELSISSNLGGSA